MVQPRTAFTLATSEGGGRGQRFRAVLQDQSFLHHQQPRYGQLTDMPTDMMGSTANRLGFDGRYDDPVHDVQDERHGPISSLSLLATA